MKASELKLGEWYSWTEDGDTYKAEYLGYFIQSTIHNDEEKAYCFREKGNPHIYRRNHHAIEKGTIDSTPLRHLTLK